MELMDIVAELKNASVQMPEEKIDQFIEAASAIAGAAWPDEKGSAAALRMR